MSAVERDATNRRALLAYLDRLAELIDADPPDVEHLRIERRACRRILAAVSGRTIPGGLLVSLDTFHDPPLAAVAIGDPDAADHVTFLVPGMGRTTAGMTGWVVAARNLRDAQRGVAPDVEHAVIAWIGYETPSRQTVRSNEHARVGGRRLAADIDSLCTARDVRPTISVVAHSYGTATACHALSDTATTCGGRVRTLVLLGSAGVEQRTGGATTLRADRVFAAEAPQPSLPFLDGGGDPWAFIGRNVSDRIDPLDPAFGAEALDITEREVLLPVSGHAAVPNAEGHAWCGYLDRGTASLDATARVTACGVAGGRG